ncbi:MAG: flagellar export protein FliJ [Treponema sp.]|nr:flagellar export protein FliJ [Candidatus Treponema equifaecale]
MKRFEFPLEKIQSLREFKKKQAEIELGKAVQEETKIQDTLNMIAQSRVQTMQAADQMKDINSLYNAQLYFQLLDARKEEMIEELTRAQLVTEEKRGEMEKAMRDCKVLENYKAVKKAEWKKQMLLEEENAIDEIVTSKYNRQDS